MTLTSVIIPARNERYLGDTLDSLYANAGAPIETIVVLDGPNDYEFNCNYPNLTVIHHAEPRGIRPSINAAVAASQGEYILKLDAHCILGEGFVATLLNDIDDDWVSVARRYTLDLETMQPTPRAVDYYYLSCPWTHPHSLMMQSCPWLTRTEALIDTPLDDLLCFQGSMWLMSRKQWDWIGGLEEGDLTYAEHHEISMKTWLTGGRVVINKNTWYAHPRKVTGGYHMNMDTVYADHATSARRWIGQPGFVRLIDKFWPLPLENTRHRLEKYFWPEDWKKYLD